jgi:hypothetical protein
MNDEQYYKELTAKLRKLKGIGPLTPEEADAEYENAPEDSISPDEIRSIVGSVTSGDLVSWEPVADLDWTQEMDLSEVEEDALQLYRNRGEDDEKTDEIEDELRDELLSDDDEEPDAS